MPDLTEVTQQILRFRDEREWAQFHSPRNLAAALAIEAAEVQELMLWKQDGEVTESLKDPKQRESMEEEIGDVLIFALLLAHSVGVEPLEAIQKKIRKNAAKYPVELARGRADKYTELRAEQELP